MTMPIDLVLLRHGKSEGNEALEKSRNGDDSSFTQEFLSRHNSTWHLVPEGEKQPPIAGAWIRENIAESFDAYFVSEYIRAMQTAAGLGFSKAMWTLNFYLRERDWGQLDVMTYTQRSGRFAEELARREKDGFFWAPPGGESIAHTCLRVDRVIETLHRECSDKRVLMVCHGEIMWSFRVRLERLSQSRYYELDNSKDPHDKIHNCQVVHYTRRNPHTGGLHSHLNWFRSVCPMDLSLSSNNWQEIKRPRYSNEDLIAEVRKLSR